MSKRVSLSFASAGLEPLEPRLLLAASLDFAFSLGAAAETQSVSDMATNAAGNACVVGTFRGTVDFDPLGAAPIERDGGAEGLPFLAGYSGSGDLAWVVTLAADDTNRADFTGVALDGSGNVYATGSLQGTVDFDPGLGTSDLTSQGDLDIFVMKLDSLGNLVWAKNMGGAGTDGGQAIGVDSQGNVYTAGRFQGTVDFDPGPVTHNMTGTGFENSYTFLSKLDSSGNYVWAKVLSGESDNQHLAVTPAGDAYVAGDFLKTMNFGPGFSLTNAGYHGTNDVYIAKYSSAGTLAWARRVGGIGDDAVGGIAVDDAGALYAAGSFAGTADFDPGAAVSNLTSAGGDADAYILKLDAAGKFVWARRVGGSGADTGSAVAVTSAHEVYFAGTSLSADANFSPCPVPCPIQGGGGFVVKLDALGHFVWDLSSGSGVADAGLVAASGGVFLTGSLTESRDFDPSDGTFTVTPVGDSDVFVAKMADIGGSVTLPTAAIANPGNGGTIDRNLVNLRRYLEITFSDFSGVKAASITDAAPEFTLTGDGAAGVTVGAPKLVSGSTYRYAFTGNFVAGAVNVNFAAGAFADTDGNLNAPATLSFTVAADTSKPTAAISNPAGGGAIDRDLVNLRRYLEVTFSDVSGIKAASITDAAPEFTLTGDGAAGVTVGAPKLVSGSTYRYAFTANFVAGAVNVNFIADAFADTYGNTNEPATLSFTVTVDASKPTAALAYPLDGDTLDIDVLNAKSYLDITFTDAVAIKVSTITDTAPEFTLSGAAAANVKVGVPKLVSGTTYRYPFTGLFAEGAVSVDFPAGALADLAGNPNDPDQLSFDVAAAYGWRFGNTGGKKGVVLNLTDFDGTLLKFSMTGPGVGVVDLQGNNPVLAVMATSAASAVTITTTRSATPGDVDEVDLFSIQILDPLGSLTGKTTNLTGSITVVAALTSLTLDDVSAGCTLDFGGVGAAAGAPTLVFDQVAGLTITASQMPLKAVTATEWLAGGLTAPWLGSLTVTGRVPNPDQPGVRLAGDLGAGLVFTGQDAAGKSLGTLAVAGTIRKGIQATGAIGAITAAKWDGGLVKVQLNALSVGTLSVTGDMSNVQTTLTQAPDAKKKALDTLTVGGKMSGASVTAAGNIGTMTVGAILQSTIQAGELNGPAAGRAGIGTLEIKGVADTRVQDWLVASTIQAWTLGTVTLRNVQPANTGKPLGITGHSLGAYTRYEADKVIKTLSNLSGPKTDPVDADEDFAVSLPW